MQLGLPLKGGAGQQQCVKGQEKVLGCVASDPKDSTVKRQPGGCGRQASVPTVRDSCQRATEGTLASGRLRACGTCSD